jgi:hypothetical protein
MLGKWTTRNSEKAARATVFSSGIVRNLRTRRYSTGQKTGQGRLIMSLTLSTFDMATLLDSDEAIIEYLTEVLADGDREELFRALGYIAKARGTA